MIKYTLEKQLSAAIAIYLDRPDLDARLDVPNNTSYGDYSTNVAFLLAKSLRFAPQKIAEMLCEKLAADPAFNDYLTFTPINGFVNVRLSDRFLWSRLEALFEKRDRFPSHDQSRTLLEYVSANPTGPLHVGHGRWAVLGDVMARILRFSGADITREFYINDAGNQIKNFYRSVDAARAGDPIPEDGYHGDYILELAKSYDDPIQVMLDRQIQTLRRLDVEFDSWYSEKSLHNNGKVSQALSLMKEKGLTYEQDGALWFASSQFGDEKDRVLIKADGNLTYFAVDVAYHVDKIDRGFTRLLNIWGADHHGYVPRVRAALAGLFGDKFDTDQGFHVLIGQLVSLFRNGEPVRMSKRTGEMVSLDEVIDEIGVDATRFFLIQKSADTQLDFDLELASRKSSENPVYYVQYAHARMCSIVEKVGILGPFNNLESLVLLPEERTLLLKALQIYDDIYDTALMLSPHRLVQYLTDLARTFHNFYEACPIMKATGPDKAKRLYLLLQVREVFRLCFGLLGISAPEKM